MTAPDAGRPVSAGRRRSLRCLAAAATDLVPPGGLGGLGAGLGLGAVGRLGAAAALLGSPAARATVPPPPQSAPLLLQRATLHTVAGPVIADGWLLAEQGRIRALGGPQQPPPLLPLDARVLDLAGAHVYPGFIAAPSRLGLVEVSGVEATVDSTETGFINPHARAVVAVNPDSALLPVARANGVLAALVAPQLPPGGGLAGTGAVMQLEGWTWEEMALRPEATLHLGLPTLRLGDERLGPGLRHLGEDLRRFAAQRLRALDEAFDTAAAWLRARQAEPQQQPVDRRWAAMAAVLRGERPLWVHAHELPQIRHALALADRHRLKLVLVGGADALPLAELLRTRDVPVVVGGVHRRPLRPDEPVDARYRLAAQLHQAGVRVAIGRDGDPANERNLPYEAASAAAHGLPADEALRAITLTPARILGVEADLGALAPGRLANFFVADGDPLETPTQVLRVFMRGRELPVGTHQTELADKYRQRPPALAPMRGL